MKLSITTAVLASSMLLVVSTSVLATESSDADTSDASAEVLATSEGPESDSSNNALCGVAVNVEFREGAPRDRFKFVNSSEQGWHIEAISLRLEPTAGKLVFDTEAGGKGVEVFQLFEVESGTAELNAAQLPDDGGNTLDMSFSRFAAGDSFMFSIDVDDQLSASELGQIRVADSEMAGGIIDVSLRDSSGALHAVALVFDSNSRSSVSVTDC